MIHLDDAERRRRLVVRHHLGRTASSVAEVVDAELALHSTVPITPFLACWARVPGFAIADLERELYDEPTLVRIHTMRRTLWVIPAAHAGRHQVAFADKVWRSERAKLLRWMQDDGIADPDALLGELEQRVEAALVDGPRDTRSLREEIQGLELRVNGASLAPKVPFLLALRGRIVRGRPAGSWRSNQYEWIMADAMPDGIPQRPEPGEARADVARHWLRCFGPAPREDLKWFTKWTVGELRQALVDVDAVEVELDAGEGVALPEDLDRTPDPGPTVALLPVLDPTVMAWKNRSFFLTDDDGLFDDNGNAGPVIVVDGRIVGGWGQDPDGVVRTELVEPSDDAAIAVAAEELTEWLDGVVVSHGFPSPISRRLMGS